ncbi:MAG: Asp-tRNA(Asn)/Glu-tRNA(Gln) amidotransferase subunit GatC [Elusimicrobiaceae bacterium]|nr:Asp-tRNA(Asn)/Glu-tRNA(Gln) amidotransferase subunit GatC [Elusimicrobiaceae bacterium]
METNLQELKQIAKLAKIELSAQEEEKLISQIASVVKWVEEIQKVDTSAITCDAADFTPKRQDSPVTFENADALVSAFNDKQDNFLKVKKVL